jgi:hypothetical protein
MEQILGVGIGIATVCLLLSIIASHVQEVTATFTSRRAATLELALQKMLEDPTLYGMFASHPLIQNISFHPPKFLLLKFFSVNKPRPSYIASPLFSRVLLTTLAMRHNIPATDFPTMLAAMPASPLKERLLTLMVGVGNNAAACNALVEQWYDGTMERVNGFYKRRTQWVLMFIGLLLAILCNANLFSVTSTLWLSKDSRDSVAALAQIYGCKNGETCNAPNYEQARRDMEEKLNPLPMGYKHGSVKAYWSRLLHGKDETNREVSYWDELGSGLYTLGGWFLTAIAVSLGAPFWFDMLNNFVNLRITGARPATGVEMRAAAAKAQVDVHVAGPQGNT